MLDQREQNFNNVVKISAFTVEYVEISVMQIWTYVE